MVNRTAGASKRALIEIEGTLKDVLPEVFQTRLPPILEQRREERVWMVVTTLVGARRKEAVQRGSFFRPARPGQPAEFTWLAGGLLHTVIRQFRLDFVRHLSPEELCSRVWLAIVAHGLNEADKAPSADPDPGPEPLPAAPRGVESAASRTLWNPPQAPQATASPALGSPLPAPFYSPTAEQSAPLAEPLAEPLAPAAGPESALESAAPARERQGAVIIDASSELAQPAAAEAPSEEPSPNAPREAAKAAPRASPPSWKPGELPGNFYQDFFGFEFMPFNNTPDSHFFFPTEKHQEALSRLLYAISERKGFVLISGEVGAGKSTLCRTLISQLPREVQTALITHTHLDASQLVQAIAEDLGLSVHGKTRYEILQRLNEYLIEQLAAGCTVCIIIDEAQNLSPAALEEVRLISNLETEQEKLVQLILLGQPELREKIRLPEMRQLRQRISVQYHLDPLSQGETLGYIRHRLKVGNPKQALDFTRGAMSEAHRYAGGVPRLINSLCDNALLTAYTRQTRAITRGLIREAGRDLDLEPQITGLAQFFRFW